MPDAKSPAISVRATPGTANVRGRLLASADIVVENSGGPFTLVTHAKLGHVSQSLEGFAHWEYMPRGVNWFRGAATLLGAHGAFGGPRLASGGTRPRPG